MKRILIFSGTTEGRRLAEVLSEAGVPAAVCVATEYGAQVMPSLPGIAVHQGRMDRQEMQQFLKTGAFQAVVDATHPFATEVSVHIRESAEEEGIPCLRLKRDTAAEKTGEKRRYFSDHKECADALLQTGGAVLLTTGSKELAVYCREKELRERLYVRVLPSEESIARCRKQGLAGGQIIAMQGPFTEEMNIALIRQYQIRHLVTKESGAAGGFGEKAAAAEKSGAGLYVIGNPEREAGYSFAGVCSRLEAFTGRSLRRENSLVISLIGMGMGSLDTLTEAAKQKIEEADCIFGAARLLSSVREWGIGKEDRMEYPYYLAEDIIPVLEEGEKRGWKKAALLFSGDSGFYSGCQKLYQRLKQWNGNRKNRIQICPGISSVSYFAAACGISWQDAEIRSIHGKGERKDWEAEVLAAVRYHQKVFFLVSGVQDVRAVGTILREHKVDGCRILLGYQLSYPEEKVTECTPEQCEQTEEEGLYLLAVLREVRERRYLAPQKKDSDMIRGAVPMTKEEIRELAVCKLRLTEPAAVYDIGSGTGSVAVEIAERSEHIRVYAVEQKEEGTELIHRNRQKFKLPNITVIRGKAPDCLAGIQQPATHAFIGGSSGHLREILNALYRINPFMRIVVTAVSLETVSEITALLDGLPAEEEEIIQIQVSRARKAGHHHLMQAENPVYLCSFTFTDRMCTEDGARAAIPEKGD